MNMEFMALYQETLHEIGWTLVHFLWQGLLLAALLGVALTMCRGSSARHNWALATAALMALAPFATFFLIRNGGSDGPYLSAIGANVPGALLSTRMFLPGVDQLVLPWLVGVVVLSIRTLGGAYMIGSLRRSETGSLPPSILQRCRVLRARFGLRVPVRFAQSKRVSAPVVVGWFRPIVLIPLSALAGLTPGQLDAVILHELTHIRRLDPFANIVLITLETVLFYHPAVWWVTGIVRAEREHCCDDIAVAMCGDAAVYAEALTSLETHRSLPAFALGAKGGRLKERLARVLGDPRATRRSPFATIANLSVLAALGLAGCVAAFAPIEPAVLASSRTVSAADYPEESIRLHEEGVARFRFLIGADGLVKTVEIVESSGHPRLDAASAAMVIERWRYEPARRNGEAVESWDEGRIVWRLAGRRD